VPAAMTCPWMNSFLLGSHSTLHAAYASLNTLQCLLGSRRMRNTSSWLRVNMAWVGEALLLLSWAAVCSALPGPMVIQHDCKRLNLQVTFR
jgi:hypothetical protein